MRSPRVPASVTVLSVLGLVFAGLGVLGLLFSAAVLFGGGFGPPNPALDKLNKDPGYLLGNGLLLGVGLPLLVLLFASSAGSLRLARWARVGMLVYASGAILNAVGGMIFNIVYVIPLISSALPENDPARFGALGGAIGGTCGGVVGLIYPICVLIFYTRPHVIDAFNGVLPPEPEDEDEEDDYDDRRRRRRGRDWDDEDRITDRRG